METSPEGSAATGSGEELSHHKGLSALIGLVIFFGASLFGFHASEPGAFQPLESRAGEILLFLLLIFLCEVRPVRVVRGGQTDEIVASTTFAFAMLLAYGPAIAMVAQAAASVISDVAQRKEVARVAFNVGQYWVGWGLAALALRLVVGTSMLPRDTEFPPRVLLALVVTALVYFLINNLLVGLVVAVNGGLSWVRSVVTMFRLEATSDWLLLALAPIVFLVEAQSPILLPLLLLPAYGIYRMASISVEKEHEATHDSLTGLPNRLLFDAHVEEALHQARRSRGRAAVLLIDLDRFKEVNDTLGHRAGDQLLRQIGPRIATALPGAAPIARLGGDEFVVLLRVDDPNEALLRADGVVEVLKRPFDVEDFALDVEASIGIAVFPDHGSDMGTLLQRADVAMYVAKSAHRGVELYDADKDHHSRRRLGLLAELRAALPEGQLTVHYQPQVNLATNRVESVEALVRWCHPKHGLLAPGEFVPLAEHSGLIRPLTTFVLSEAVAQTRAWLDRGVRLPVAVNLSARSLHDARLPAEIWDVLDEHELDPSFLQMEITESSIMTEPTRARRTLGELDRMGIRLSIDDFGTGYSSLSYLQQLPVSEIKIDRSFVMGMLENDGDAVIVRSIIDLARNLNLQVVAEGVETVQALDFLREAACDAVQGYLVTRALPPLELDEWFAAHPTPLPARPAEIDVRPGSSSPATGQSATTR